MGEHNNDILDWEKVKDMVTLPYTGRAVYIDPLMSGGWSLKKKYLTLWDLTNFEKLS